MLGHFNIVREGRAAKDPQVDAGHPVGVGAKMRRHAGGHRLVRCRCQHDAPAGRALFAQIGQQGLVVRQKRRIKRDERGDPRLQRRPPAHDGGPQCRHAQSAGQREQPLDQRVGAHQRAIEIDAKWQGGGQRFYSVHGARQSTRTASKPVMKTRVRSSVTLPTRSMSTTTLAR